MKRHDHHQTIRESEDARRGVKTWYTTWTAWKGKGSEWMSLVSHLTKRSYLVRINFVPLDYTPEYAGTARG
jgi:hypothetical protein